MHVAAALTCSLDLLLLSHSLTHSLTHSLLLTTSLIYPPIMSFDVTDSGDFVDGVYSTRAASVVYSLLIGRKTPQAPAERASERVNEGVSAGVRSSSSRRGKRGSKHEFTEADILYKGYLHKEGASLNHSHTHSHTHCTHTHTFAHSITHSHTRLITQSLCH
jgi:hypothetical protein